MMFFLTTFFLILIFFFTNNYIKKFNYLPNYKGQKHQKFSGLKNIQLSGGIFLTLASVFLFYNYNPLFSLFILLMFVVGFISDINFLSSPKIRLLIQSILVFFFVFLLDIKIYSTRFILLDLLLENIYFKYFFSAFCLLILINGSNFIDGLNGLMLGYFSSIIFLLFFLNYYIFLEIDKNLILSLLFILVFLLILNINNELFMGDSGAYVLGSICGYLLIKIHEVNQEISPYFIILLFWYPCFENLFSILRKIYTKKSPTVADNNHFHQLIFFFIKKKNFLKKFNANNISSFAIIIFNLVGFIIGSNDPSNTKLQVSLVFFNITFYLVIYSSLLKFKYRI
tara:strand:- start:171 stop:1190 length:1020 start_codon:yes stop_codon:yes gene_type:complete